MATIWKANGDKQVVAPANGWTFTLAEMQAAIGGGFIELVHLDDETTMVVDEDGYARGLLPNAMATALYRDMSIRNGHGDPRHLVVGDVLVCSRFESGYPWYSLSDSEQDKLNARLAGNGDADRIRRMND